MWTSTETSTTTHGTTGISTRTTTASRRRRPDRTAAAATALVLLLLAFPLAAFGGAYDWIVLPQLAGTILLALMVRPGLFDEQPLLDRLLLAIVAVSLLQLIPAPVALVRVLSQSRVRIAESLRLGPPPGWVPATVSPTETLLATGILLAAVLTFVSCRTLFQTRGVRDGCRGIAWMGLALSFVAIVQRAMSGSVIYGFWVPLEPGGFAFGPFVNRNHCAAWLVMAIPLCFGYMMARFGAHKGSSRHHSFRRSLDARTIWLATAGLTMTLALAVALSRSGLGAFAIAAMVVLIAGRSRLDWLRVAWFAAFVLAGLVAWFAFADLPALIDRFSDGIASGRPGRLEIWRDTAGLIKDFWLFGSGNGTYEIAMMFYQRGSRAYYFNQAHNHYLQVVAEGGLLMLVPCAIALGAFVRAAAGAIRNDPSRIFWIRVGASAGLVGVAAQSLWETGLRLPANAQLAAVLAALLLHKASTSDEHTLHSETVWDNPILMNTDGTPTNGSTRFL